MGPFSPGPFALLLTQSATSANFGGNFWKFLPAPRKLFRRSPTHSPCCGYSLSLSESREEESVHYHHRKKIIWRTFLASKKNFLGRWWVRKPYKNQENHSYHRNLSSVASIFLDAAFLLTAGSFLLTVKLFLLTVDNFGLFAYSWPFLLTALAFSLTVGAFLLTVGKCV